MNKPIHNVPIQGPAQPQTDAYRPGVRPKPAPGAPDFAETVARAIAGQVGGEDLRFSNHAQKRLQSREISLSDDGLARLADAVGKAEKRGGRESLILMDDMAFIVNVRQRLVVTALDARKAGEGVFTQIDSVVLAEPTESRKTAEG